MSKKTRAAAFGAFVGIFLASYMIGTSYKMSDQEAQKFLIDFQNETEGIDAVGIFKHNALDSLPMFVPGFGVAWGSFTGWQTGAGFSALVSLNPSLSDIPPISLLLASPFGTLELVTYSIGMSRSFILIQRILRKNPWKKEIKPTMIEIGIAMTILLVAAFIEYSIINQHNIPLSS